MAHAIRLNNYGVSIARRDNTLAAARKALDLYRDACRLGLKVACRNAIQKQGWIYNRYSYLAFKKKRYRRAVYWARRAVALPTTRQNRATRLRNLRTAQKALRDQIKASKAAAAAKSKHYNKTKTDAKTSRSMNVGAAAAVIGDVKICIDGQCSRLRPGKRIQSNSRIVTGPKARLSVLLDDDSAFTVGPNADLVIDKFVYDPFNPATAYMSEISKGVVRFVSGRSRNQRKQRWKFCACGYTWDTCGKPAPPHKMAKRSSKSGSCSGSAIGIRGTDFVLRLAADRRSLEIDLLDGRLTYAARGEPSRTISPGFWMVKRNAKGQETLEQERAYHGQGDRELQKRRKIYNGVVPIARISTKKSKEKPPLKYYLPHLEQPQRATPYKVSRNCNISDVINGKAGCVDCPSGFTRYHEFGRRVCLKCTWHILKRGYPRIERLGGRMLCHYCDRRDGVDSKTTFMSGRHYCVRKI